MEEVVRVELVERPSAAQVRRVTEAMDAFNVTRAPFLEQRRLFAVALSRAGTVGGGIAFAYDLWCELDTLWVHEGLRRKGVGRRVLEVLEEEARRRGCRGMHTDTFSFQALPFYEAAGYEVFGQLEGFSRAQTRYYLRKEWS